MAPSVLSEAVDRWATPVLEGRVVRLEPLAPGHADDLWEASRDPRIWRWLPVLQPRTREEWDAWMASALERTDEASSGRSPPCSSPRGERPDRPATSRSGRSTRASRSAGPGSRPTAWSSGANAEAKLLQLEYAFETLGCHRVEFKTDALNERARPALAALPARFEGIHRKHMLVRDGVSRDSAWYSVLDDEWPAVRDALRERLASAS